MSIGSEGVSIGSGVGKIVMLSAESISSKLLLQKPGDVGAIGEGRGVISTKGPSPGDEYAEPGERELTLGRAADNAERTLVLRTGSPVLTKAC